MRRMRQRCGELFREEIAQTVAASDEIDDEVPAQSLMPAGRAIFESLTAWSQ